MRVVVALACLLWASPVWAQAPPLPDYDTCAVVVIGEWSGYNIYQQTTPGGPSIKVQSVPQVPPWTASVPCPTAQGTYYYYLRIFNSVGEESVPGTPIGFTIKGGAPSPSPPPLVLQVGGRAQVNALNLLNVRATPGGAILGTQRTGTVGTLTEGPVAAMLLGVLQTFWRVNFDSGVDGWCAAPFLVPTP